MIWRRNTFEIPHQKAVINPSKETEGVIIVDSNITEHDWEAIFGYAAEDIGVYLNMIHTWPSDPADEAIGGLLIDLFEARDHVKSALDLMDHKLPDALSPSRETLFRLWQRAEALFIRKIESEPHYFETAIGAGIEQARSIRACLEKVRHIAQDVILTDDPNGLLHVDVREAAHDFILRFQKLNRCVRSLEQSPLNETAAVASLKGELQEIEKAFRRYHGYFTSISDLIPTIRRRELGADHWWLSETPDPDKIHEDGTIDRVIEAFRGRPEPCLDPAVPDCPMSEMSIALALGEVAPEQRESVKHHVSSCRWCMDLFFDVRVADHDAAAVAEAPMSDHPAVSKAMEIKPKEAVASGYQTRSSTRSALESIRDVIKHGLGTLFAPGPLSVLVACSLIIAVTVNFFWDNGGHFNASITMMVQPPVTRSRDQAALRKLPPKGVIHTGEDYQVRIRTDRDGYAHVALVGDSGRTDSLYKGPIHAQTPLIVPDQDQWKQMDPYMGSETIILIVSHRPIDDFSERLTRLTPEDLNSIESFFPEAAAVESFSFEHR